MLRCVSQALNPLFHPRDVTFVRDCPRGVPREAKMCLRLIAETDSRSVSDSHPLILIVLYRCRCDCVRYRRTARREGEIQDDQRGPRLHVHRTRWLLVVPTSSRPATRPVDSLSCAPFNCLLCPPTNQFIDQLIVSRLICFRLASPTKSFDRSRRGANCVCLLYHLLSKLCQTTFKLVKILQAFRTMGKPNL